MAKKPKVDVDDFERGNFTFFSKEIEKMYGGETVKVSDASEMEDPDPNSTGSISLDFDLGVPFPEGTVVEIFGDESSFKSTIALQCLAEALNKGKDCLIVNAERSLNRRHLNNISRLTPYLEKSKGDGNRLKVAKITSGEEALNTMRLYASQFPRSVVVLDSVDACLPEAVITGEIGEKNIGNQSKLMSDALRKLIGIADDNNVTLIFINQMRSKITTYGDPNETSGGRALKYYAHQRIKTLKPGKSQQILDGDGNKIGVTIRYTIIKNRFSPPDISGEIPLLFGSGFDEASELLSSALMFGVLKFGGRGGKQPLLPTWRDPIEGEEPESNGKVLDWSDEGLSPYLTANAPKMIRNDSLLKKAIKDKVLELL